jgi:hypothetical protein
MSEDLQLINKTSSRNIFDLIKEYETGWEEIFIEGIKSGAFKKDLDYKIIVKSIFGMMNWSYRWYNPKTEQPLKVIANVMKELILGGVLKNV